jgi:hypothetical protein
MVLREFILPPPTLITSVTLSHLPPFFANRIIFKCFRMSNEKSEDCESILCALLITQILKDDYTDFLELSRNYISL